MFDGETAIVFVDVANLEDAFAQVEVGALK